MIRVAIIGAGIGAEHLQGYRSLPDAFRVSTICDLDRERAAIATGGDLDIRITDDLDAVLADDAIDLIDVCLPPHLHVPVSVKALQAGKHVICEKPIARSMEEAAALKEAMDASGKRVFPVFQYRYGRALDQLRALLASGYAGKAYVASLETHWNRDAEYYAVPWRGTVEGEVGGALVSHAIHSHDLLCHVFGPVAQVSAMTDTRVNDIETEDCAAITFRMENGALATSSITLGAGDDTSRLKFCFEGFTAESGTMPYTPAQDRWTFTARAPVTQAQIDAVLALVPERPQGFAGYLNSISDALNGRAGSEVTLADGQQSIELATALYLSVREDRSVSLPLPSGVDLLVKKEVA